MTFPQLLEGRIEDPHEQRIAELEAELRELRSDLANAKHAATAAKRDATKGVSELRRQLTPLYRAIQAVFGEMDTIGVEDAAPASATNPHVAAVWASWKSKFHGKPAAIIDALLVHREMNTTQIAIAIGSSRGNVPPMLTKLNKAGLLQKNGNMFSLKAL